MGSREREEFTNQYKRKVVPIEEGRRKLNEKKGIKQERYTAPKGTMNKAKARRKRRVVRTRIASLILASAIGVGGLTAVGHHLLIENKDQQIQLTEMSSRNLHLNEETMNQLEKYAEYFENYDKNDPLSDEDILKMVQDIENLNFDVIKEKMGNLLNEDKSNIKLYYKFEKADGKTYAAVTINDDDCINRQVFSNDRKLIFPNKNTIPREIENGIIQIEEYENIRNDLANDRISKVNSVKQLKKLYKNIENIASGELIKDEKGNITLVEYDKTKENGKQQGEER